MSSYLKSVSAKQIQDAIAKAFSEITGETFSVSISALEFGEFGGESLTFTAIARHELSKPNGPLPF